MEKLMYFTVFEDDDMVDTIKSEKGIAYSESTTTFICFENVFKQLSEKYDFPNAANEGGRVFETGKLGDMLEQYWGGQTITLDSLFSSDEVIKHDLDGDWEIALEAYQEEDRPDHAEKTKELFESKDWYNKILKDVKIEVLSLIADSVMSDAKEQIKALEKEF